ncbi:unnamed protein product [Urochloa humidicola]
MAIPVARVHLAMAHAALPGLLPSPPKCAMLPLLSSPPCAAIVLPNNSPPRPSRADAAERWDTYKIKPAGGSPASSSSPGGQNSLDSSKKIVTLTSSASSRSSSRADSEERWDAHKRPASPASSSSSSASSCSNKTKTCHVSRLPAKKGGRAAAASSAERWDAQKKPRALAAGDELDDGVSSNGSNDVEMDMPRQPPRSLYAGPEFIRSPEPSMLPKPSFMIRVA